MKTKANDQLEGVVGTLRVNARTSCVSGKHTGYSPGMIST